MEWLRDIGVKYDCSRPVSQQNNGVNQGYSIIKFLVASMVQSNKSIKFFKLPPSPLMPPEF